MTKKTKYFSVTCSDFTVASWKWSWTRLFILILILTNLKKFAGLLAVQCSLNVNKPPSFSISTNENADLTGWRHSGQCWTDSDSAHQTESRGQLRGATFSKLKSPTPSPDPLPRPPGSEWESPLVCYYFNEGRVEVSHSACEYFRVTC